MTSGELRSITPNSNQPYYEVIYIDKFLDADKSNHVLQQLRQRFALNDSACSRLGSGRPITVKQRITLATAKTYADVIRHAGGCCWIQQLGPNGEHIERRHAERRTLSDRRSAYRVESISSDRRQYGDRRHPYIF